MVRLVFREDHRVEEVRRCLQSSRPIRVALTQRPEVRFAVHMCVCVRVWVDGWVGVVVGVGVVVCVHLCGCACMCLHDIVSSFTCTPWCCSDHQFLEEQEEHLLLVSQRTMALPVAR